MNVLFVHNNFPAQYRYLARFLARQPDVKMMAIGSRTAKSVPAVELRRYMLEPKDLAGTHPFARRFDLECQRAEQVLYALSSLVASGFKPDVILAHPGWGETLPLRVMFPEARILVYCEFFYGATERDVGFDPEFPTTGLDGSIGLKLKNAATLLALNDADLGISPTAWQRSTFPAHYQSKIDIVHEGVNVDDVHPDAAATFMLPSGKALRRGDEVVTFVVRNMEPLRGYHIFMRMLPRIMRERPNAQFVIAGGDGVSYGASPPKGTTWKSLYLKEVEQSIDPKRLHFVGALGYAQYLQLLQVSSAHVYLTYPFVLSWSMLEAMASGCVVIGSDTPPVAEVIEEGVNGFLVPFFDLDRWASRVIEALAFPARFEDVRRRARQHIIDHYDMERICLPKMAALLQAPAATEAEPASGITAIWPGRKREEAVPRKRTHGLSDRRGK